MSKIIEYTLVSADGVFEDPWRQGFKAFRDDAYLRDGLGQLLASEAMLMGRNAYQSFAKIWPSAPEHPWSERLNSMPKYVFSANLEGAAWENTTVVRGDVVKEVTKLKYEHDGNLLIWGHTQLAETLLANQLIDILDLSVHPVIVGTGKLFFREGQQINLRLASTKVFSNIAKLTYECRY